MKGTRYIVFGGSEGIAFKFMGNTGGKAERKDGAQLILEQEFRQEHALFKINRTCWRIIRKSFLNTMGIDYLNTQTGRLCTAVGNCKV